MSRERGDYERDWSICRRCQCRRPMRELQVEAGVLVCIDRGWCDSVVLWREEQKEQTEAAVKKTRRSRRKPQSRAADDEEG